jgi:hypothetical protein
MMCSAFMDSEHGEIPAGKRLIRFPRRWVVQQGRPISTRRTRRSHALWNEPEAFFVAQLSADSTTDTLGFDLRQEQVLEAHQHSIKPLG